ncbi:hypothetical protein EJB05_25024, partial [Eragrostis curvula]
MSCRWPTDMSTSSSESELHTSHELSHPSTFLEGDDLSLEELLQPLLPSATSNKKRVAPGTGNCSTSSELTSARSVRWRICTDPAGRRHAQPCRLQKSSASAVSTFARIVHLY